MIDIVVADGRNPAIGDVARVQSLGLSRSGLPVSTIAGQICAAKIALARYPDQNSTPLVVSG